MTGPGAMARARVFTLALGVFLSGVGLAAAQGTGQPAELPPASYKGKQYVDSQGCVFLRAGTQAQTVWIPRVTASGELLCGYPPSGRRVPVVGEAGAETGVPEAATASAPAAEAAAPAPVVAPAEAGSYVVALGSFGFASNVAKAEAGAGALGYPVVKGQLKGGETGLITVFAGPFDSKAAAEDAQRKLRKAGFPDAVLLAY